MFEVIMIYKGNCSHSMMQATAACLPSYYSPQSTHTVNIAFPVVHTPLLVTAEQQLVWLQGPELNVRQMRPTCIKCTQQFTATAYSHVSLII